MTEAQRERLTMLIEECGEVIQAASKVLRHGYDSRHPDPEVGWENNRETLERELVDLWAVVQQMDVCGDVEYIPTYDEIYSRWTKKLKWTHHQVMGGTE